MIFKRILTLFIIIAGSYIPESLSACEISYNLTDSNGQEIRVSPDSSINLNSNESYTLIVDFFQDHGKCKIPAEDTDFLLEEEKWKISKDYLPFKLLSPIEWINSERRSYRTNINFSTVKQGKFELQVVRDCNKKEGYDDNLSFNIQ